MYSSHLGSTGSVSFSPAEGRKSPSDHLMAYLNLLHGFGHWKQAVGHISPAGMNFSTFAPLTAWPWASVRSRLASNSFDLAVMAEPSNPSTAFLLFLLFLCACHVSCCSVTTFERSFLYQKSASHAVSWSRADASLMKSWYNSRVHNWGECTQNHILAFSGLKRNEQQKIQWI